VQSAFTFLEGVKPFAAAFFEVFGKDSLSACLGRDRRHLMRYKLPTAVTIHIAHTMRNSRGLATI
jgi:hypothetical protein